MRKFDEWSEDQELADIDETLSLAKRAQLARKLNRLRPRIERRKKILRKKVASSDKLNTRAERAARQALERKLSGGYAKKDLPLARRQAIEDRLKKKLPAIKKLAKRLLPGIRKAEVERVKKYRSNQSGSGDS